MDSYIIHDEFVSVYHMSREYDYMKEEIKNQLKKLQQLIKDFNLFIK